MSTSALGIAPAALPAGADTLAEEVLAHLHAQIASVERLLEIVVEQGTAIRTRDVHEVVRLAGLLHGELSRREQIERDRTVLLQRAGARLGIEPARVTVTQLAALMEPGTARAVRERSARLQGLLDELRGVHNCNREVMRIELAFLDHLMQSLQLDHATHSYDPRGAVNDGARVGAHGALHMLDLQA
ncbi:MAG TPA: flagellar export chaperone FlgN [Solirubrobacteraceae bacterium]|nr:flagellar export chaperone FlgN [Solirubrobacteraceae bacterium]